jgi:hypothetical protein
MTVKLTESGRKNRGDAEDTEKTNAKGKSTKAKVRRVESPASRAVKE